MPRIRRIISELDTQSIRSHLDIEDIDEPFSSIPLYSVFVEEPFMYPVDAPNLIPPPSSRPDSLSYF